MEAELTLVDRVKAGAGWLDEHYPGWHNKVDTFTLTLRNGTSCVLGQVYAKAGLHDPAIMLSPYAQILDHHEHTYSWSAENGFAWFDSEFEGKGDMDVAMEDWETQATLLWISEVNARIYEETQDGAKTAQVGPVRRGQA